MDRVSAVILRSDLDRVLDAVAQLGVLHPARIEETEEWAKDLSATDAEQLTAEYTKRRLRLQQLMDAASLASSEGGPALGKSQSTPEFDPLDAAIEALEVRLSPLQQAQAAALAKRTELTTLSEQLAALLPANVSLPLLARSSFLATEVGSVNASRIPDLQAALADVPSFILPYRMDEGLVDVVCVVLLRDKALLESCLRDAGFREASMPQDLGTVTTETQARIVRELATLETELSRIAEELSRAHAAILPEVQSLTHRIDDSLTLLTLKDYCRVSDKASVFAGWVPSAKTRALVSALRAKTEGRAIIDVAGAEALEAAHGDDVDVPVWIQFPVFLRPFKLLVDGYGVPSYRMLDPTLFVAVTFLVMFGMMFGDVGHGLVLAGAGVYMFKTRESLKDASVLVIACGAMSALFGFLFGSVFGFEHLIPTLWIKPLENTTTLFFAAIALGAISISVGLILNIVNAVRSHAFLRNFFDVSGPLTALAYWAAAGLAVKAMLSRSDTSSSWTLWLVIAPLAAFFAKGPVLAMAGIQDKAFPEGVIGYLMECVVKILEVLMGCLANTVSFIRVGAFGLAHAGLFLAIFSIADAVSSAPGGTVMSWLVLIVGNIIVIVLEGVVVTIQALRLEYYEFFSKFFSRMGTKYQPVSFSNAVVNTTD